MGRKIKQPALPWSQHLAACFSRHGWLGRMFGAQRWLTSMAYTVTDPCDLAVIAVRHQSGPYGGFELLDSGKYSVQHILVDCLPAGAKPPPVQADVHLVVDAEAPAYTAFNLGAAVADARLLLFIEGAASPRPELLTQYLGAFADDRLVAARGRVSIRGLDECAYPAVGSFSLSSDVSYWPVDLDENMCIVGQDFYSLGGFDESLIQGYGALDLSIKLYGKYPDITKQWYLHDALVVWDDVGDGGLPFMRRLQERQKSWLQMNTIYKEYLALYGTFWLERLRETA